MNVPARLAGFALLLVAVFGVGVGIGRFVGPFGDEGVNRGPVSMHAVHPSIVR